jgi:diadenylate cyclase
LKGIALTKIIQQVEGFLEDYFQMGIPDIHVTDVVEIIIIAFFLYQFLKWIKSTRAWMLFRGILVIVIFFLLAALFRMSTILWLGERLLNFGLIALVVVFQPELRKALEQLGRKNIFGLFTFNFGKNNDKRFSDKTLTDLVKGSFEMGAVKTGALIVIEGDIQLNEYVRTGIEVDGLVTRQLLINIFEKNTPLHDGAVIIRGDRVVAATCYLPLSDSMEISKALGTRHRAGLGISEVSDATTIIVSEETGMISVTKDGKLYHDLTADQLTEVLRKAQELEREKPEEEKENNKKKEKKTKKELELNSENADQKGGDSHEQ